MVRPSTMLVCIRFTQPDLTDLVDLVDLVAQGVEPLVAIRRLARDTA